MPGMVDMIGLGILLRWKDKATAEMMKAEKSLGSLGDEADEVEKKTARLQASFAKLGKVGAVVTAFGVGGAAALYGLARSASTFEDSLRDTMTMTGLTGDAFEAMETQLGGLAVSMSTRFAMSAADINKAFYQVLSSGAQAGTRQFEALSDSALKLARVVGMEPAVAVEVVCRNQAGIVSQVDDFSIDIGIVAGKSGRPEVEHRPWLDDELCLVAAAGHPLADGRRVAPEDLARYPWVLREEGSGTREVLLEAMPEAMAPFRPAMVFDNPEAVKMAVQQGGCITCLSRMAVAREIAGGPLALARARGYRSAMHTGCVACHETEAVALQRPALAECGTCHETLRRRDVPHQAGIASSVVATRLR